MHPSFPLAALLALAVSTAHALTIDAKALARFDISYAKCETQFPAMRGHRDESYLSLWRVNADKKARAQLAEVRKGALYQAERRLVLQGTAPSASAPASSVLQQQCQALWAETQRVEKLKQ
jgi:hypothetical protein